MEFRVWMIINPPSEPFYIPVKTIDEVMVAFLTLAKIGNHSSIREAMEANCSGLEYKDKEGDWVEYLDKDGEDIESYWYMYQTNPQFFNKNLEDFVESIEEVENACT